jgi:hypothetical protein
MRIRKLLGPRSGMDKFGSVINIPDQQHCKKPCKNLFASLPLDLPLHISSAQIFGQLKLIHLLKDQKGLKNAKTPP